MKRIYFLNAETREVREITSTKGETPSFEEMYKLIGCSCIEHVGLSNGVDLWIDEEGKFKEPLITNVLATALFRKAFPMEHWLKEGFTADVVRRDGWDTVVGNAIVEDRKSWVEDLKLA